MQYLKSIENSIELMPLRVKIEIVLLPLILLFSIYFFFLILKKRVIKLMRVLILKKL